MWKRFVLLFVFLSLLLTGCSIDLKQLLEKEEKILISNLSGEALTFKENDPRQKTIDLISSANKSIYIEQTAFSDEQLKNLIITKAKSGVEVRILLDQFTSANRNTLNDLKKNNISVQYYPAQKGQTNDVKFLIVDLTKAMVYSSPWTESGFRSHNLTVTLSDQSAFKLAEIFNRDWQFTTTLSLELPEKPDFPEDNILFATNTNVKQQLADNISKAESSVWVIVSDVTDGDLIQSLINARTEGKEVKLILSPKVMPSSWPGTLDKLTTAGVEIRYLKNQQVGVNLGIFDAQSFILSSSGWSYSSFVMDHELSITVPAPVATAVLTQQFNKDWQNSTVQP